MLIGSVGLPNGGELVQTGHLLWMEVHTQQGAVIVRLVRMLEKDDLVVLLVSPCYHQDDPPPGLNRQSILHTWELIPSDTFEWVLLTDISDVVRNKAKIGFAGVAVEAAARDASRWKWEHRMFTGGRIVEVLV